MPATTRQALGAEAVGTFVLVVVGVGALLMTGGDYLATGLAFGLTAVALTSALGWASGGHFNPAVSLGAALVGRLSWGRSGLYALVQTAGALLAGATLWGLMHGFPGFRSEGNLGQNSFGAAGSGYAWWAAFLLETLMTAVLVGVVLAVTDERATYAGLAPVVVGLTLAVLHLASMAATVTSVNPARSVGVGVFAGAAAVRQLWLFVLAPLLGAVVAGLGYPLLRGREAAPGLGRHRAAGSEGAGPAGPRRRGPCWTACAASRRWRPPTAAAS
ncbi:MAG TPA: aquaporin [Nocardioides sp.]|uniref:aquaporin n=1 Tax=Nocardioides sp. TaxID=35761 RepID=UPI002B5DE46E|nr:aquaporin [Nocardioides sp.]HQR28185.1 aquaporin [Nocardioides sp.]